MTREEIDQILAGNGQSFTPQTTMTREQIDSIISGGSGETAGSQTQNMSNSAGVQSNIPAVSAAQKQTSKKNDPALNRALGMAMHTSQALLGISATDLKSKAKLLQRTAAQEQDADDTETSQQNQSANSLDKVVLQHNQTADNSDIPQTGSMNKEAFADSLVKYSAYALTRLPSLKPQVDISDYPALSQPLIEGKSKTETKSDIPALNAFMRTEEPLELVKGLQVDGFIDILHAQREPLSYGDFMEKSFENVKTNAGGFPENTPDVVKEAYVDKWLQPGYKMNKHEIKQAKQYLKDNSKYLDDGANPINNAANRARVDLGLEGEDLEAFQRKREKLMQLDAKTDLGQQIGAGILSALPLTKRGIKKVIDMEEEGSDYYDTVEQNAVKQNPIGFYGGNVAMQMAKYKMGTAALGKLGVTDKLSGALGKVIKNEKVAGHAANVLGDTSLDVAFDTVPSLVEDVQDGESAGTVAKNAAKNIGTNLAFNIGGEAVSAGIGAVSKNKKVKDILANPDSFTMETGVRLTGDGKIDKQIVSTYLDELDKATAELAKSAPVDEAVKSAPVDDVVKDVLSDDITKSAVKNADDIMQDSVKASQMIDSVDQANIKMIEEAQKEGFIPLVYERSNGIQKYTELQMNNLSSPKGKVNGIDDYEDFIRNSLNSNDSIKFYLGTVSDELGADIMHSAGVDLSSYNIVFKSDDVRHSVNHHGSADEALRGQLPLTEDVLNKVPAVFNKPDKIELSPELDTYGRKAIIIEKRIDGKIITVEGVSQGQHSLFIDTVYATPARTVNALSPHLTSKTSTGVGRINSMLENGKNVNNEIPSPNTMDFSRASTVNSDFGLQLSDMKSQADPVVNNITENGKNVNNEIPSPTTMNLPKSNKTMAEDIGLSGNSGLPWETVGGTKSVAEKMGIPDIRKYQQPQGDTLSVSGEKVSKFRTNTMAKEGNFSPEEDAEVYCKELYKYIPKSEKETFDIAASRVASDADGWYKKVMEAEDVKGFDNAEGIDTMMQLSTSYRQQARAAKEAGNMELARSFYAKSRDMTMKLAAEERKAGQELQALKKYTTPSDKLLIEGEKRLQNRIEKFTEANPNLMKEVDSVGDAIYRRVRELEETSDLWKQLAEADLSETAGTEARDQLRKQVADIIKQEAGKNKTLRKKLKNSTIDKLAEDILELNNLSRISSELESLAATGVYGVSDNVIDQVTDILADAERYHVNSKERVLLEKKAGRILAEEVAGTSVKEMWDAWRYACMLLSPKTWMRNISSTAGMCATNGIKNNMAALMEMAVEKSGKNIDRTKAVLNPVKDSPLMKSALKDADNTMYRELKGNRFFSLEDAIEGNKRVFKGNNKVTSALAFLPEKLTKTSGGILDAQDYFFVKRKYGTSLTGYMKANGLGQNAFDAADQFRKTGAEIDKLTTIRNSNPFQIVNRVADAEIAAIDEQIAALKNAKGLNPLGQVDAIGKIEKLEQKAESIARKRIDGQVATLKGKAEEYRTTAELLDKGRQYAKSQAEESAFHQDNKWANALSEFSRRNAESKHLAGKITHMLIEGNVPFKKTPANVLKNGLEYSPLNLVLNNLEDFFPKKGRVKNGTASLSEAIDSLSKTLTGTGLFAAGWLAYEKGMASAVVDKFEKLTGEQDYSLRIGGKSYTLDWAAPGSIPFFAGVTTAESLKDKGFSAESVVNILAGIGQPVIEMSMMNGISNTLDSIQYMDKDDPYGSIGTVVGSSLGSYFNQGLSFSALGQIARATDNTRRSTYTDKTGFMGSVDRAITKGKNKLPVLSKNNQPYIDAWGREQQNLSGDSNMGERLAYQMLSPGYMSDINMTPVDQEVQRLYDATSDKSVLPSDSTKKIDDIRMTKEEYTTYSKAAGQARYNLLASCLDNVNYKALDEDVQAEVVKDLYGLAKKIGSAAARPDYESKDNLFKTYQESGLNAAVNYAITAQAEDMTWVPISKTDNSERYEQVNGMDMPDDEKGKQLRMGANNSEVADKVYESFDNSDSAVYDYYTLDEMAKGDSSNKTEKGEARTFSQSSLGKQYFYLSQTSGSAEEKGKMLAAVNNTNEKVQTIYNAFGGKEVLAYAQLDSLAREDVNNVTEDGEQKSFGQSNIVNQYRYVERLGDNVSREVKGTIIALSQTSSDKVQAVFKKQGGWGVMEYAKIKSDTYEKDGRLTANELKAYLDRHYTQTSSKKYWFSMVGNKNWKNPY